MKYEVFKADSIEEYFSEEGCFIQEVSNSNKDAHLSIAKATVKPGEKTEPHRLINITERYVVISGKGTMNIEENSFKVEPGDVVLIPPGAIQSIHNNEDFDLIFYCICTPRFVQSSYERVNDNRD